MSKITSVAAVWFTHPGVEPWHIGHFAVANPGIPNYVQNCALYDPKKAQYGWRNTDRILVTFWRGRKHEFKQYSHLLLTEYDVLFNAKFSDIYPDGDYDLAARYCYPDHSKHKKHDGWKNGWWKKESLKVPAGMEPKGLAPLMPMLISTEALEKITDPKWDFLFEQNLFNEVRWASIAHHEGFRLSKVPMPWNQAEYERMPKDYPPSVYHPVKHPVTMLRQDTRLY